MRDCAIEVDQLCKTFDGVVALDRLTFHVPQGEIFALLGPNGAGKSTTIRILLDMIRPDAGTVRLLGGSPGLGRDRVGYLPQERGLYPELRVEQTLVYLGELKGMTRSAARKRAQQLLARVELADSAQKRIEQLSRGMVQKVQILAALIHDPELVILDEPFQNLDPINVVMIRELIREFHAAGKTVVLSAHEMSQVEALCDRLLLIDSGRAALFGTLAEIKKQRSPHALSISPPVDLNGWPGVLHAEVRGRIQTVHLAPEVPPRAFLHRILDVGWQAERFESAELPLEQIFISAIKGRVKS